jgi:S-adenosylhomocysteine hydrolase
MENIYYDVVEDFTNDLEKKISKKIELNKEEKNIKIDNETIEYEEKDIGFRSFSVPYFVKNQTVIKYNGNDKELKKAIVQVCTAYTDKEIEAIEKSMPILKKYSEERNNNLKGVAIIWRDHFLEENVGLLTSFVRMGVDPTDILAIDKGDSTKHREEITETFKKLGYQVDILDNTAVADDILIEDGKKLVKDFIEKRRDKKIVILDDGAIVSRILTLHSYENVEAFVELTVTGLKRIKDLDTDKLSYPVLNVAKSKLKRFITYKEISNTIFTRSIELLGGAKLVGRTVIQLGYGDLGEVLAERYRQYGARLIVIEPDVMKCIDAAEKGFTTFRTLEEAMKYEKPFLIVGASGYNSISREVIEKLDDGTFVTSGATADLKIFKEYEKEGCKYKEIPKYGTQYEINGKHITVLGNGRSVNLFDSEAIPNQSNDIFKASQIVVTDKIINTEHNLKNRVELDIVDQWIEESGILEQYYDLYFRKG